MARAKEEIERINNDPSQRDASGKFVKGNKVRPYNPTAKRKDYYPILKAVAEDAYTPEQLTDLVHEMVEIARAAGDWKGIYAALSFILAYTVGKPVQRSITASMDADQLRAILLGEEISGGDEEAIDVTPTGGDNELPGVDAEDAGLPEP